MNARLLCSSEEYPEVFYFALQIPNIGTQPYKRAAEWYNSYFCIKFTLWSHIDVSQIHKPH